VIDGVLEFLVADGEPAVSGGSRRNREHAAAFTTFADHVAPGRIGLLCDATTSGGLLVAVPEAGAAEVRSRLSRCPTPSPTKVRFSCGSRPPASTPERP
jgi:selenophosphate synthase